MSISESDIEHLAHLARLAIDKEQLHDLTKDLGKIMQLVEQMSSADTTNVQPLAHPLDETQPLRCDKVTETNQRDQFQALAPETTAGLYIVPQVIDQE